MNNKSSQSFRLQNLFLNSLVLIVWIAAIPACASTTDLPPEQTNTPPTKAIMDIFNKPLVTDMYTADPSAHIFDGKIYIYPSHDLDHDNMDTGNSEGDQFDMEDYHVFSMDNMQTLPVDLGEVLNVKNVPWASKQM